MKDLIIISGLPSTNVEYFISELVNKYNIKTDILLHPIDITNIFYEYEHQVYVDVNLSKIKTKLKDVNYVYIHLTSDFDTYFKKTKQINGEYLLYDEFLIVKEVLDDIYNKLKDNNKDDFLLLDVGKLKYNDMFRQTEQLFKKHKII